MKKMLKILLLKTTFYFVGINIILLIFHLAIKGALLTKRRLIIVLLISIAIALYEVFKKTKTISK
ncbi:hypothetical protein BWZ22_07230 [Seonamhaeicola sp. S2-3]|nr:hypothetical protein BWZ22_07230 [Seonamhaeicola sp. S2-3]